MDWTKETKGTSVHVKAVCREDKAHVIERYGYGEKA